MNKDEEVSIVKKRICVLCTALGLSRRQFSLEIGMSHNYVTNLNKDLSRQVLHNILVAFPTVNIIWLITGEGEIFIDANENPSLLDHYRAENAELKEKIYDLNKEIGRLELMNELSKKSVQQVDNAECADVKPTGSDNL